MKVLSAKERIREARRKYQIPSDILQNSELLQLIDENLPKNYNFEIPKTIWHIKQNKAKNVAIQFPEGLLVFSIAIEEILSKFLDCNIIIMGDVSYGACCIDDYTASIFNCDMIVHYGHSCLVPIDSTEHATVLYIFVDIKIDQDHFMETVKNHFGTDSYVAFITTIQFAPELYICASLLEKQGFRNLVPQAFPLSKGEVLGCTAPVLDEYITDIIFLGDGRFHIESLMIQYPHIPSYKYDPYSKIITREVIEISQLLEKQYNLVEKARKISPEGRFGIVLGTLGRQGNTKVLARLTEQIKESGRAHPLTILVSEVSPQKLDMFQTIGEFNVEVWVQIACPRLSIDWSASFTKPILTTYELSVVTGHCGWRSVYPMDYYAADSLGPWTPNHNVMANSRLRKRQPKSRRNSLNHEDTLNLLITNIID